MTAPHTRHASFTAVFSTSTRQLVDNLWPTVGAMVVWGLVSMGGSAAVAAVTGQYSTDSLSDATTSSSWAQALGTILTGLLMAVVVSCAITGFFRIARGYKVRFGDFFSPTAFIPILLSNVIVSVLVAVVTLLIGTGSMTKDLLSVVVSLLLGLLFVWSQTYAAGAGLNAVDAILASVKLTIAHPGATILVVITAIALSILGVLGFGIALVFTIPLAAMVVVNYFRGLTGEVNFALN